MNSKIYSKITMIALNFAPIVALAQATIPLPTSTGGVVIKNTAQLSGTIQMLARVFGSFIMAIAVFMLLFAAFKFLTSGGDDEAVASARRVFTYGIVGIVVSLIAFSVPILTANFLGGAVLQ